MTTMFSTNDPQFATLSTVPLIILANEEYPEECRKADAALVRKVAKWAQKDEGTKGTAGYRPGINPDSVPFTRRTLASLFGGMKPAVLDVERKTMQNALCDCNRIADLLGMPRGYARMPLSPEARRLQQLLRSNEDRGGCTRLLRFLSARNIDPAKINDGLMEEFRKEIEGDWRVKDKLREFRRSLYAWNSAVKRFPDGWPQVILSLPIKRQIWGYRWSHFPATLEQSVDQYFLRRLNGGDLHADGVSLKQVSVTGQKATLRMVACALLGDGVGLAELTDLRSLCGPDQFDRALRVLSTRAGHVNSTIHKYSRDMASIGKHSGVLTKPERKLIKKMARRWALRYRKFKETYEDRDQVLLDELDDPKVVDSLLSLSTRTLQRVLKSKNRLTVGHAYSIQKALLLELWLCAPIRINNVLALELGRHFFEVTMNGTAYIALRLKPAETKNKNGEEHFLNGDTAALLELYVREYRDLILKKNGATESPFLFPGKSGQKKTYQSKAKQMNRWIKKHTKLAFHPHAVRKIVPKLVLDADPAAIELAVNAGGWVDDTMVRRIYGPRIHRPTQKKYLELLESRRLTALSPMRRNKRR